ncbi:MAG: chorismate synthase [Oscillospiraceae bacterium]|jgi:chorismate synthase|nr:chorismate synthase [Oscillospiraceae bacterium]
MGSSFGEKVKISIFGESHGKAIGVVIDGFPAGFKPDFEKIQQQMDRRAPGRNSFATPRAEADRPNILSGFCNGTSTGAPICAMIENTNTKSGDYAQFATTPRPGHADFTGNIRYNGFNDQAGGGHFSGRLTAPLVFCGALFKQFLAQKNIFITAHISSIGNVSDDRFNSLALDAVAAQMLEQSEFPVLNSAAAKLMKAEIEKAKQNGDSIGGTIECGIFGLPAGLGDPIFGGVENKISAAVFGVPAVKGIEFGDGFALGTLYGSQSNDEFYAENNTVKTKTNRCGGILGGITTGMPVIFRAAIKPTPSIAKEQQTVNLNTLEQQKIKVGGRHDPCIVPRAVVAIESAAAAAVMNILF